MTTIVFRRLGIAVLILVAVAVVISQQRRISGQAAENLTLRDQVEEVVSAQAANRQLVTELAQVTEEAKSQLNELMKLRALASRTRELEKATARLEPEPEPDVPRAQREPETSDLTVADEDTPEWSVARAAMVFSKELGIALHEYAGQEEGQMPPDLLAALESLEPGHFEWFISNKMPGDASFDSVRDVEFEIVYFGRLYQQTGRDPSKIIVARQAKPLELSNGRWARACVFGDGSSRILVADSRDALAAIEEEHIVSGDAP